MAAPAYKFYDRRGTDGGYWGQNALIQAATQNNDRKTTPDAQFDFHRSITPTGRRTLATLGRSMFWNIPALQGAILEQANLAVGTFLPQYWGQNAEWGNLAEAWLESWHKIFDVAGWPWDYEAYLQALVMIPIIDGDFGTLLTETADGYPMIQIIPGHRIGSRMLTGSSTVDTGTYAGQRLVDGVIVDETGRPLAYRVYNSTSTEYQDISTRDMFLVYVPMFPGQVRGISLLASSAFPWQDILEHRTWEMIAQKVSAGLSLIEYNESGEASPMRGMIATKSTTNTDGTKATPDREVWDGGMVRYFKANSGGKLQAHSYDRPGANAIAFQRDVVRDCFRGIEWDAFFSLDPGSISGPSMRIVVEKINSTLRKRRRQAGKACARVDGYGLAKAIKLGLLTEDPDWWKIEHQGPQEITADRKYDSDVDCQEIEQGLSTRRDACARRSRYWRDADDQRELEADSDLTRAGRLAKKHGITIQEAILILRPPKNSTLQARPEEPAGEPVPIKTA